MTRLNNNDEARARDAEWFEGDIPPNAAWLGASLIAASAVIVIVIAALIIF